MGESDRTRSLEQVDGVLTRPGFLEEAIGGMVASCRPLDALEIGFGRGRVLLELAWLFREQPVRFHGVDLRQDPPVERREDLRGIARAFDIVPEAEIDAFELPQIFFYDATNLHFDDESMGFVWSAVTIRFVRDKAHLVEEVCRVLRPGGRAVLHMSESNWDYPYSRAADDRILTPYTNRFVLRHGRELIPLPAYLMLFEGGAFTFAFVPKTRCILLVEKSRSGTLDLELDYNDALSMGGRKLPLRHRGGKVRGGWRSVYDVRPERYRELFDRGFLREPDLRTDIALPA